MINNGSDTEQLSFDSLLEEPVKQESSKKADDKRTLKKTNEQSFSIHLITDLKQFMDYVGQHKILLTDKLEYISKKYLPAINEQLHLKKEGTTASAQQEQYPAIHFFYHLALGGNLLEKVGNSKLQLKLTERWGMFTKLTDTEKYFFLLETFWVDLNWTGLLEQHNNRIHQLFPDVAAKLMEEKSGCCIRLDEEPLLASLMFDWNYFLLYMEWLGLWACEKDQAKSDSYGKKNRYFAKTITLTTFGKKIIPILLKSRNLEVWNIPLRRENGEINPLPGSALPESNNDLSIIKDESTQSFYQAFTNLYSQRDLCHTLPRLETKYTNGIHAFRVAFGNKAQHIVLSANNTMEDLHHKIIMAYALNDDHLYSFFMDGRKWSNDCIASPLDDSGQPNASNVAIGSIGMRVGQRFMYLFDYGEELVLTIKVEEIRKMESGNE